MIDNSVFLRNDNNGLHIRVVEDKLVIKIPITILHQNHKYNPDVHEFIREHCQIYKKETVILSIGLEEYGMPDECYDEFLGSLVQYLLYAKKIVIFVAPRSFTDFWKNTNTVHGIEIEIIPISMVLYTALPARICNMPLWNPSDDKLPLFLIGKLRSHRLLLLLKLNEELKDQFVYTLNPRYFMHGEEGHNLIKYIDKNYGIDITNDQLNDLVLHYKNMELQNVNTWQVDTSLIPYQLYESTQFDIVCETFPTETFVTEKTYRPILVGRPFVISSAYDNIYRELNSMGYKTFLEYTSIPLREKVTHDLDIPQIDIAATRIKDLIKSCKDKNILQHIKMDVVINRKIFAKYVNYEKNKIFSVLPELKNDHPLLLFRTLF